MRLPLLAALLCAAVGASAAAIVSRSWEIRHGDATMVRMTEVGEEVDLLTYGAFRFSPVRLTHEEAASLGRALLEAAGESRFQSVGVDPKYSGCITLTPNPLSTQNNTIPLSENVK